MTVAVSILERAGEQLGDYLPRIGGALAILVIGLILTIVLSRLIRRALRAIGTDDFGDRAGVHNALELAGLGRSLSAVVAGAIRWTGYAVVAFAAFAAVGPLFLSDSLNRAVLFLPNVLLAAAMILAGVVVGSAARVSVERSSTQMSLTLPLGAIAQALIVALFILTAAAQIGVSTEILTGIVAIVLGGAVATIALAFGLGGRDAARAVSAGRYVRDTLRVGQVIRVGDHEGRIRAMELTATVIDRADGATLRIPNGMLLDDVVVIVEDDELPPPTAP